MKLRPSMARGHRAPIGSPRHSRRATSGRFRISTSCSTMATTSEGHTLRTITYEWKLRGLKSLFDGSYVHPASVTCAQPVLQQGRRKVQSNKERKIRWR